METVTEYFALISESIEEDKLHQLHIACNYNDKNLRLFWISLKPDKGNGKYIAIGSFDNDFFVTRIDEKGQALKTLPSVQSPHITLHYDHFFHLMPNKGKPIFSAITFGADNSERKPFILWIRMVTSPLDKINLKPIGKRQVKTWSFLPTIHSNQSVVLFVDFVKTVYFDNELDKQQSRFIKWGKTILRIRMGLIDACNADIILHG